MLPGTWGSDMLAMFCLSSLTARRRVTTLRWRRGSQPGADTETERRSENRPFGLDNFEVSRRAEHQTDRTWQDSIEIKSSQLVGM